MGTGKTTVGRLVAEQVGSRFVDLDEAIAARAGRSIAEIFERQGEGAFRKLEQDTLAEVLQGRTPLMVAVGGGTLTRTVNRRLALARARVVTLTASAETSCQRLLAQQKTTDEQAERPLLAGWTPTVARVVELLEDRRAAYAEAHATVDTGGRSPALIAQEVLHAWSDDSLLMPLGQRSHAIRFAGDLGAALSRELARLQPTSWFLVTDETVGKRWLPSLQSELGPTEAPAAVVRMGAGETHKTVSTATQIAEQLIAAGADRGSVLVALGGGVVSDVTGFVAATLFRGVRWIALPTTTLAMVDASVGGKTGVDLASAKNAVGAFHQPSAVLVRIAHVETETARAHRSGLAEAVKAGAIGDPALLDELTVSGGQSVRDPAVVERWVRAALQVKISIVASDEREGDQRALLNFGHTVGHAIEAAGAFDRWTHGESVAMGMVAALELGQRESVTDVEAAARLLAALRALGLPTEWRSAAPDTADYLRFDKKRRGQSVRVVFLRTLGDAVCRHLPLEALRHFVRTP